MIVGFETTATFYEALDTYPAVAGVGSYNVSLTQTSIILPPTAAIFVSDLFTDLLTSPLYATSLPPHSCSGAGCISSFILGSYGLIQPPPLPASNYSKADSIFLHRLQGVQVEFWDSDLGEQFTSNDCKIWGTNESAIEVCIRQSSFEKNYLVAGIRAYNSLLTIGSSVCPLDTYDCLQNDTWSNKTQLLTALAISQRTADVVYSRTTRSILSTSNISSPTTEIIAPSDFFLSFETIFGLDSSYPESQYDIDPFSANAVLIDVLEQSFSRSSEDPSGAVALSLFRGILATPLVLFQPTYLNPNFNFSSDAPPIGLPPELYVAVDLSESFQRLMIPKWTWIVYAAISLSIYLWCVGGMVGAIFVKVPPKTPFEVIDFASRIVSPDEENAFANKQAELSIGRSSTTRRKLQDTAVVVSREGLSSGDGGWKGPQIKLKIGTG